MSSIIINPEYLVRITCVAYGVPLHALSEISEPFVIHFRESRGDEIERIAYMVAMVRHEYGENMSGFVPMSSPKKRPRRLREVLYFLDYAGINDLPRRDMRYLDYGCGDGFNTVSLAKEFKISKANALGIDIRELTAEMKKRPFTYMRVNPSATSFNIKDSSLDLITAFVALHHVHDAKIIIKEFARIIKPGGYVFIREYDCNGTRTIKRQTVCRRFLNQVHIAIEVRGTGSFPAADIDNINKYRSGSKYNKLMRKFLHTCNYFSESQLAKHMKEQGFQKIALEYLPYGANEQRLYHAIYQKEH